MSTIYDDKRIDKVRSKIMSDFVVLYKISYTKDKDHVVFHNISKLPKFKMQHELMLMLDDDSISDIHIVRELWWKDDLVGAENVNRIINMLLTQTKLPT